MISYNEVIEDIRDNNNFKPILKDNSYYRTYKSKDLKLFQIRISANGTNLWSWYDMYCEPSHSINYSIVFSPNGKYEADISIDMNTINEHCDIVGVEVIQYVYNCQLLELKDAALINQAIQSIRINGQFEDPLANTNKQAKVMKMKPQKLR